MKILYDNEIFIRQEYGGISRYYFELIRRLSAKPDIKIKVYKGFNINKYDLESYRSDRLQISGRKIPAVPRTKYIIGKLQKPLFRRQYLKTNFNIFHSTYYNNFKKKQGTHNIITILDFTHEKYPNYFSKLDTTIKDKRKAAELSDGIICISQSTKNDLLNRYRTDENKVRVIYLGNSLTTEPGNEPYFKFPYILYVGDRRRYKNFNNFIKGYANSEKLKKNLQIVCFGGGEFSKEEINLFKVLNIESCVNRTSGDDNKLANIYKFAFMFIYPSFYEGFGITLLEAMHYGCPVLASNISSLPEIGGDAAEYFNPEVEDEITYKLELLLENNDLRENLKQKGYKREKLFSWDKCAEETYNFYKEIYGK
jgi:glycosyltransferase involved in cell wall biosynthesis